MKGAKLMHSIKWKKVQNNLGPEWNLMRNKRFSWNTIEKSRVGSDKSWKACLYSPLWNCMVAWKFFPLYNCSNFLSEFYLEKKISLFANYLPIVKNSGSLSSEFLSCNTTSWCVQMSSDLLPVALWEVGCGEVWKSRSFGYCYC